MIVVSLHRLSPQKIEVEWMRASNHVTLKNAKWTVCTHFDRIATIPLDNILTTWNEATGFNKDYQNTVCGDSEYRTPRVDSAVLF